MMKLLAIAAVGGFMQAAANDIPGAVGAILGNMAAGAALVAAYVIGYVDARGAE